MERRGFLALLGTGAAGGTAVVGSRRLQFDHSGGASGRGDTGQTAANANGPSAPASEQASALAAENERLRAERDRLQSQLQSRRERREQELIGLYEQAADPRAVAESRRDAVREAVEEWDWHTAITKAVDGAAAAKTALAHLDELRTTLTGLWDQGRVDDYSPQTATESTVFVGNLYRWHQTYADYCAFETASGGQQPGWPIEEHVRYEEVWEKTINQLEKNDWTSVEEFKDEIEFSW